MKKLLLINETIIHTHAIEINTESEDDFEQLLEDLENENFEDREAVLKAIGEMHNIEIVDTEYDNDFDVTDIDFDSKEVNN